MGCVQRRQVNLGNTFIRHTSSPIVKNKILPPQPACSLTGAMDSGRLVFCRFLGPVGSDGPAEPESPGNSSSSGPEEPTGRHESVIKSETDHESDTV